MSNSKKTNFTSCGFLPSESELASLHPVDAVERLKDLYENARNEFTEAFEQSGNSEFLGILQDLMDEGELTNQDLSPKEMGAEILPGGLRDYSNRKVATWAIILARRQIYFRGLSGKLAGGLLQQITAAGDDPLRPPSLGRFSTGISKATVIRLCWLSYVLGLRSMLQQKHTESLKDLPNLFRGIEMDRSKVPASGSRKPRLENAFLKGWVEKIILAFREGTTTFPSKKQLEGLIESQVARPENQKGNTVFWSDSKSDGKKRLGHRRDSSEGGVTMSTITETWIKEFRKLG
ncbi:MAG: hypothetical protein QNL68_07660 [Akkermansiaceae bacterium]